MKLKYFLLLLISFFYISVFSQEDKLKQANKMFDGYAFIDAQKIYLEVANAGFESENLFKKLGDSYYFNNDLQASKQWYAKLFELNDAQTKEYIFRYAQALKSVKEYDKADQLMLEYDQLDQTDSRVSKLKSDLNYLELIEMQSDKFSLDSINVNSPLSDFAPKVINDSILVFASNRKQASSVQRIHEWNNEPYLDLYQVILSDSLQPAGEIERLPDVLNSKFHESSATYTKDGKTIYFTRNNFTDKKFGKSSNGVNYLKLYKSTKNEDDEWTKPEELPFNSDEYSVAHPCLNADETKLYFASDMPGTRGMSDVFYVNILEDGSYSEPINMGDVINTEGKESFPYVDANNLLYFSSNGHAGLGGLDVFVVLLKAEGDYGDVFNVGRPINSPEDDFSLYLNSKTRQGLFASNRAGGKGGDDLYIINQKEDLIVSCEQYLEGVITTLENNNPLEDVKVELFDEDLNLIETMSTNQKGEYRFKIECNKRYVVRVSKDGYKTIEELIKTNATFENQINKDFKLTKGSELGVTKADQGDDLKNLLQLDPIYFDLDDSRIRPDAEVELQKVIAVLKQYPQMKIDVRSHTDSRAGDTYNKVLSDKRAKSTINYIASKGIESSRLSGRGYGESQLVNGCSNGVNCTEAQHELNRRAEFIILNKNETPQSVRDEVYQKVDIKGAPKTSQTTSSKNTAKVYDFENSNELVYTVQIGAYNFDQFPKFPQLNSTFYYKYEDGYKRFFTGIFKTRSAANQYKKEVRAKGFKDAFTIGLKGLKRIY